MYDFIEQHLNKGGEKNKKTIHQPIQVQQHSCQVCFPPGKHGSSVQKHPTHLNEGENSSNIKSFILQTRGEKEIKISSLNNTNQVIPSTHFIH